MYFFLTCFLFTLSFSVSIIVYQEPIAAASDKQSCPFTAMQAVKTLPIDSEKYGHPVEISWSPDDHYLALGTVQDELDTNQKSNLFMIWDTRTWKQRLSVELPSNYTAQSISWSPDNGHVALFYRERSLVWNTTTWQSIEITVPESNIYRASWIDNNSLMTLSDTGAWLGTDIKPYGNVSRLWNVTDGSLVHDFGVVGLQSDISRVDDRWLIVTNDGKELRAYYEDDPTHDVLRLPKAQLVDVNASELAAVATFQNNATIHVWEIQNGKELLGVSSAEFTGTGHFLANGKFLLLNQYDTGGEMWDIEHQQPFPLLAIDRKDYQSIRAAWSLTTHCAAAATFPDDDPQTSPIIDLFDMLDGQPITRLKGHQEGFYVTRIAWSSNGQLLASSSTDDTVIIWQGD